MNKFAEETFLIKTQQCCCCKNGNLNCFLNLLELFLMIQFAVLLLVTVHHSTSELLKTGLNLLNLKLDKNHSSSRGR